MKIHLPRRGEADGTAHRNSASTDDRAARSARTGIRRLVIIGITAALAAYTIARLVGSLETKISIDSVYERVSEAVTDDAIPEDSRRVSIDRTDETRAESETAPETEDGRSETDDAGGDELGVDRSAEEIAERGVENVQEEPAEPGELTVSDDIVDDLVDDGDVESETADDTGKSEEEETEE